MFNESSNGYVENNRLTQQELERMAVTADAEKKAAEIVRQEDAEAARNSTNIVQGFAQKANTLGNEVVARWESTLTGSFLGSVNPFQDERTYGQDPAKIRRNAQAYAKFSELSEGRKIMPKTWEEFFTGVDPELQAFKDDGPTMEGMEALEPEEKSEKKLSAGERAKKQWWKTLKETATPRGLENIGKQIVDQFPNLAAGFIGGGIAGPAGGFYGSIGKAVVDGYGEGIESAQAMGIGDESLQHIAGLNSAAIEGTIPAVMNRFAPGLEGLFGRAASTPQGQQAVKTGIRKGIENFKNIAVFQGKVVLPEELEEIIVEGLQNVNRAEFGGDPDANTIERQVETAINTAAVTFGLTNAAGIGRTAMDRMLQSPPSSNPSFNEQRSTNPNAVDPDEMAMPNPFRSPLDPQELLRRQYFDDLARRRQRPQPGAGPQPGGPQPGSGPQPGGPQPTGPQPGSGPQPGGPQPTGPQPAGPQPGGPQPTDPDLTDPQPTDPQPQQPLGLPAPDQQTTQEQDESQPDSILDPMNGRSFFTPEALQNAENDTGYKSKNIIIEMSPEEFLRLAEPGYSDDKTATVASVLDANEQFRSIPHLTFANKGDGTAVVVGHEGRHRARALIERGVTSMPVKLMGTDTNAIRWSEQSDRNYTDRIKGPWPQTLFGEGKNSENQIPFPVKDPLATDQQTVVADTVSLEDSVLDILKLNDGSANLDFLNHHLTKRGYDVSAVPELLQGLIEKGVLDLVAADGMVYLLDDAYRPPKPQTETEDTVDPKQRATDFILQQGNEDGGFLFREQLDYITSTYGLTQEEALEVLQDLRDQDKVVMTDDGRVYRSGNPTIPGQTPQMELVTVTDSAELRAILQSDIFDEDELTGYEAEDSGGLKLTITGYDPDSDTVRGFYENDPDPYDVDVADISSITVPEDLKPSGKKSELDIFMEGALGEDQEGISDERIREIARGNAEFLLDQWDDYDDPYASAIQNARDTALEEGATGDQQMAAGDLAAQEFMKLWRESGKEPKGFTLLSDLRSEEQQLQDEEDVEGADAPVTLKDVDFEMFLDDEVVRFAEGYYDEDTKFPKGLDELERILLRWSEKGTMLPEYSRQDIFDMYVEYGEDFAEYLKSDEDTEEEQVEEQVEDKKDDQPSVYSSYERMKAGGMELPRVDLAVGRDAVAATTEGIDEVLDNLENDIYAYGLKARDLTDDQAVALHFLFQPFYSEVKEVGGKIVPKDGRNKRRQILESLKSNKDRYIIQARRSLQDARKRLESGMIPTPVASEIYYESPSGELARLDGFNPDTGQAQFSILSRGAESFIDEGASYSLLPSNTPAQRAANTERYKQEFLDGKYDRSVEQQDNQPLTVSGIFDAIESHFSDEDYRPTYQDAVDRLQGEGFPEADAMSAIEGLINRKQIVAVGVSDKLRKADGGEFKSLDPMGVQDALLGQFDNATENKLQKSGLRGRLIRQGYEPEAVDGAINLGIADGKLRENEDGTYSRVEPKKRKLGDKGKKSELDVFMDGALGTTTHTVNEDGSLLVDQDGNTPQTGQPFSAELFIGSGRSDKSSIYLPGVDGPTLGQARYSALTERDASGYGPNVNAISVSLNNPLVIDSDQDIENIGGMPLYRVVRDEDEAFRAESLKEFRRKAEEAGHDGVIVFLPANRDSAGPISGGRNVELRNTFGMSQVIEFNEQPVAPKTTAQDEPRRKPRRDTPDPGPVPTPAPGPTKSGGSKVDQKKAADIKRRLEEIRKRRSGDESASMSLSRSTPAVPAPDEELLRMVGSVLIDLKDGGLNFAQISEELVAAFGEQDMRDLSTYIVRGYGNLQNANMVSERLSEDELSTQLSNAISAIKEDEVTDDQDETDVDDDQGEDAPASVGKFEITDDETQTWEALRDHLAAGGKVTFNEVVKQDRSTHDDDALLYNDVEFGTREAARIIIDRVLEESDRDYTQSDTELTPEDAERVYDALIDLQDRSPKPGSNNTQRMRYQAYSTPLPMAWLAAVEARETTSDVSYDPTAGTGNLLIGPSSSKFANELMPARYGLISQSPDIQSVENQDATEPTFRGTAFDVLLTNPPFSQQEQVVRIPGAGEFRTRHFIIPLQALQGLSEVGRAVLIISGQHNYQGLGYSPKSDIDRAQSYSRGENKKFYDYIYNNHRVVDHYIVEGELYGKRGGATAPVEYIVIDDTNVTPEQRANNEMGGRPNPYNIDAGGLPRFLSSWSDLREQTRHAAERQRGSVSLESNPTTRRTGKSGGKRADIRPNNGAPGAPSVGNVPLGPDGIIGLPGGMAGLGWRRSSGFGTGSVDSSYDGGIPTLGEGQDGPGPGLVSDEGGADGRGEGRNESDPGSDDVSTVSPIDESQKLIPYEPGSTNPSMEVMVPSNQDQALKNALSRVKALYGDLAQFVASETGLDIDTITRAERPILAAEQVDAAALSIAAHKSGSAFILAYATGIGKGRVLASQIAYAKQQGLIPVFVTAKENLHPVIMRDLQAIGLHTEDNPFVPFVTQADPAYTNLNSQTKGLSEMPLGRRGIKDKKVKNKKTGKTEVVIGRNTEMQQAVSNYRKNGVLEAGGTKFDAIFTTYSQFKPGADSETRRKFLGSLSEKAFFILDEAHVIAGKPKNRSDLEGDTTANFFIDQLGNSGGAVFASATFAKYPESFRAYARTGFAEAVGDVTELAEVFKRGGDPLMQMTSSMFVEAGFMSRLERPYDGINFNTYYAEPNDELLDQITSVLRNIYAFSLLKKGMGQYLVSQGNVIPRNINGDPAQLQADTFGSMIWRAVDNILLSVKVEEAAADIIKKIRPDNPSDHEKAVVVFDDTLEAALQDYERLLVNEAMEDFDRNQYIEENVEDENERRIRDQIVKTLENQQDDPIAYINGYTLERLTDRVGFELDSGGPRIPYAVSDISDAITALIAEEYLDIGTDNEGAVRVTLNERRPYTPGSRAIPFSDEQIEAERKAKLEELRTPKGFAELGFDYSLKTVLQRYLRNSTRLGYRVGAGPIQYHYITEDEMTPQARELYDRAKRLIDDPRIAELPGSPIDAIRMELEKAGLKVGEITGRQRRLELATVTGEDGQEVEQQIIVPRPKIERDKTDVISAFNGMHAEESFDVLLVNPSVAEGADMHASIEFLDQRKRHMFLMQLTRDVARLLQLLGRINRTGQVVLPEYTVYLSTAPFETRPASIAMKKMKTLNANVTANTSTDSELIATVPDIINVIGSQVLLEINAAYMEQTGTDLFQVLGVENPTASGARDRSSMYSGELISKFLGRMAILGIQTQRDVYAALENAFNERYEYLKSINQNPLIAQTLDLRAKTIETSVVKKGDGTTPGAFGKDVVREVVEAVMPAKLMSSGDINAAILGSLAGEDPDAKLERFVDDAVADSNKDLEDFVKTVEDSPVTTEEDVIEARGVRRNLNARNVQLIKDYFGMLPGTAVEVITESIVPGGAEGTVQTTKARSRGIVISHTRKNITVNPTMPSNFEISIAVMDSRKRLNITLSSLVPGREGFAKYSINRIDQDPEELKREFNSGSHRVVQTREIITGNVIAGFKLFEGPQVENRGNGELVFYTDDKGRRKQGILMPNNFNYDQWKTSQPVPVSSFEEAKRFFEEIDRQFGYGDRHHLQTLSGDIRLSLDVDGYVQVFASRTQQTKKILSDTFFEDIKSPGFRQTGGDYIFQVDNQTDSDEVLKYMTKNAEFFAVGYGTMDVARRLLEGEGTSEEASATRYESADDFIEEFNSISPQPNGQDVAPYTYIDYGTNDVITNGEINVKSDTAEAPVNAATLVNTLYRTFGVANWVGGIPTRSGVDGFYRHYRNRGAGEQAVTTATRAQLFLSVNMHEIGHAIDDRYGLVMPADGRTVKAPPEIIEALKGLDYEVTIFKDKDGNPLRKPADGRPHEGFAEFFRRYYLEMNEDYEVTSDPRMPVRYLEGVRSTHPQVLQWWEETVEEYPELKKASIEARRLARRYMSQDLLTAMNAMLASTPTAQISPLSRGLDNEERLLAAKRAASDFMHAMLFKSHRALMDDMNMLKLSDERIAGANEFTGLSLNLLDQMMRGTAIERALTAMEYGPVDPLTLGPVNPNQLDRRGILPKMRDLLYTKEEYDEMGVYAWARHLVWYLDPSRKKGPKVDPAYNGGMSYRQAFKIVEYYKQNHRGGKGKHRRFEEAAKEISRAGHDVLRLKVKLGLMPQSALDRINENYRYDGNEFYFPLGRVPNVVGGGINFGRSPAAKQVLGTKGLMRRTNVGSGLAPEDPLLQIKRQLELTYQEGRKHLLTRYLIESTQDGTKAYDQETGWIATAVKPRTSVTKVNLNNNVFRQLVKRRIITKDDAKRLSTIQDVLNGGITLPDWESFLQKEGLLDAWNGVSLDPEVTRQSFVLDLIELGQLPDPMGALAEYSSGFKEDADHGVLVTYMPDGELKAIRVQGDLYDAIANMTGEDAPGRLLVLWRTLRHMNQLFVRTVVPWSADFFVTEMFLAYQTSLMLSSELRGKDVYTKPWKYLATDLYKALNAGLSRVPVLGSSSVFRRLPAPKQDDQLDVLYEQIGGSTFHKGASNINIQRFNMKARATKGLPNESDQSLLEAFWEILRAPIENADKAGEFFANLLPRIEEFDRAMSLFTALTDSMNRKGNVLGAIEQMGVSLDPSGTGYVLADGSKSSALPPDVVAAAVNAAKTANINFQQVGSLMRALRVIDPFIGSSTAAVTQVGKVQMDAFRTLRDNLKSGKGVIESFKMTPDGFTVTRPKRDRFVNDTISKGFGRYITFDGPVVSAYYYDDNQDNHVLIIRSPDNTVHLQKRYSSQEEAVAAAAQSLKELVAVHGNPVPKQVRVAKRAIYGFSTALVGGIFWAILNSDRDDLENDVEMSQNELSIGVGGTKIAKVPVDRDFRVFFRIGMWIGNTMVKEANESKMELGEILLDESSSRAFAFTPGGGPAGSSLMGAITGQDYHSRPIKSREIMEEHAPASYQYDDDTTPISKFLGYYSGMAGDAFAPYMLDFYADQFTGGTYTWLHDVAGQTTKPFSHRLIPGLAKLAPFDVPVQPTYDLYRESLNLFKEVGKHEKLSREIPGYKEKHATEIELAKLTHERYEFYGSLLRELRKSGFEKYGKTGSEFDIYGNGVAREALGLREVESTPSPLGPSIKSVDDVPKEVLDVTYEWLNRQSSGVFPPAASVSQKENKYTGEIDSMFQSKMQHRDAIDVKIKFFMDNIDQPVVQEFLKKKFFEKRLTSRGVSREYNNVRRRISSWKPQINPNLERLPESEGRMSIEEQKIDLRRQAEQYKTVESLLKSLSEKVTK